MTRTWLITGSARGLGRELAVAALETGDAVVATARRPERLQDLVDRFGDRIRVVELDGADPGAAAAAVEVAVEAFGRLDVVVNGAGSDEDAADPGAIEDMTEESFRRQLESGLIGAFSVTRAALPVFRRQRSGHFLQISPIDRPGLGVEGFAEALHREVEPHGVRVTLVEPGVLNTDRRTPSIRLGDPARAARVLVDVVGMPHPPRRLPLGSDALRLAERSARARAQEADVWADVSRSVDASGAGESGLGRVLHLMVPAAS